MTDWDVYLTFEEGSSSKFWRARTDGGRLFVNFGRIGSDGQTQIKDFDDEETAQAELEKVAASKRKKGYVDAGAEGGGDGDDEEAAPPPRPAPAKAAKPARAAAPAAPPPQSADLALQAGGRKVDLRLVCVGSSVRTVVVEHYDTPATASAAFARLKEAIVAEGYKAVASRTDL
jgi:predicted DNA-binding WGR domain protein